MTEDENKCKATIALIRTDERVRDGFLKLLERIYYLETIAVKSDCNCALQYLQLIKVALEFSLRHSSNNMFTLIGSSFRTSQSSSYTRWCSLLRLLILPF